ncbi:MAG: hypothetical protein ACOC3V_01500 [bacterium]
MKIVWASDDKLNYIIRFNKKEINVIGDVISNDKSLNNNFEITDIDEQKYLFKQKDNIQLDDCVNFLKLRFAKDIMEDIVKKKGK